MNSASKMEQAPAPRPDARPRQGGLLAPLRARLAGRPDSEHEMSVNRFIFLVLMMLYLWAEPVPQQHWALVAMGCGLVVTIALFAHILWQPGANPVRRAIAFCADLSTISLMIYFTGEAGAIFRCQVGDSVAVGHVGDRRAVGSDRHGAVPPRATAPGDRSIMYAWTGAWRPFTACGGIK